MDKNNLDNVEENIQLLTIVQVEKEHRIRCQADGCKHSVYKQIHVVRINGTLMLFGISCFTKKFHNLSNSFITPLFSSSSGGRVLTDEERKLLVDNTENLIAYFQKEFDLDEGIRKDAEEKGRQEKEHILDGKLHNETNSQNHHFVESTVQLNRNIDLIKVPQVNRLNESFYKELSPFVMQCKLDDPFFDERQVMRSMWAHSPELERNVIEDYSNGTNKSLIIDLVIRHYRLGTTTDPWRFSLNLLKNYSIPKIATFRILSDFGLLRVMPKPN